MAVFPDPSRYQNVQPLSEGAQARVLIAHDLRTDRLVAIKVIDESVEEDAFKRFGRECRVLSCLSHPAIIPILDWGQVVGGGCYLTMPYDPASQTLADRLKDHFSTAPHPLNKDTVVGLVTDMASALDFIHSQGLCHRDLKPSNVLVHKGGRAVLIDFGLVGWQRNPDHTRLTRTGALIGTMAYLSPEQSQSATVGAPSDLYQMGLLIYEMVTGQRACQDPFDYVKRLSLRHQPFDPPSARSAFVSEDVERVILRLTDPEPDQRYSSGEEVVRALQRIPASRWMRDQADIESMMAPLSPNTAAFDIEELRARENDRMFGSGEIDESLFKLDDDESTEKDLFSRLPSHFHSRYRLDHILGKGGAGIVYRGVDQELGREVAVKFMQKPIESDTDSGFKRFIREAKVLAKVNHPNLVQVYDLDVTKDIAYIVFEHVAGSPLSTVVERDGPLPEDTVRSIALDVINGLDFLHKEGIVHRDIKPSNLMLTPGGTKIIDLGIARTDGTLERLTKTGDLVGTPAYTSPEQLQSSDVDFRSDYYSLGLVLYFALSGRLPFEGNMIETLAQKVKGDAPPISQFVKVDPEFGSTINALLDREPSRRPESAENIRSRLMRRRTRAISTDLEKSTQTVGSPGESLTGENESIRSTRSTRRSSIQPDQGRLSRPALFKLIIGIFAAGFGLTLLWLHLSRPAFKGMNIERTLDGLLVRFERVPPGPASLKVTIDRDAGVEFETPSSGAIHELRLTDLEPGQLITLQPTWNGVKGSQLTLRHQDIQPQKVEISENARGFELAFETSVSARARIRTQTRTGFGWTPWESHESTKHRIAIPVTDPPVSGRMRLALRQGESQLELPILLDSSGRTTYLKSMGSWFAHRIDHIFITLWGEDPRVRRGGRFNSELPTLTRPPWLVVESASPTESSTAPFQPVESYVRMMAALPDIPNVLPPQWILHELGGPEGVLDSRDLSPEFKNGFYRSIYWLELLDAAFEQDRQHNPYQFKRLYAPHMSIRDTPHYEGAHQIPLVTQSKPNSGNIYGPAHPLNLVPELNMFKTDPELKKRDDWAFFLSGTMRLGRLTPTTHVELHVKTRMLPGRQIHVLINNRYVIRLTRPHHNFPDTEAGDLYVAFDPKYLEIGENTFSFVSPPLPPVMEVREYLHGVTIEAPGFDLRMKE